MPTPEPDSDEALLEALSATQRRSLGCYFTPEPVARLMASRVAATTQSSHVALDPAAGSGRLLTALERVVPPDRRPAVVGVECQPQLVQAANRSLGRDCVRCADALGLLDPAKRRQLIGRDHVDLVIANPPYVREKGHLEVLAEAVRKYPGWARFRAPRGDLQQLFLVLGAELLAPEGELVFLVNPYWLQSDSARVVREHLDATLRITSLVHFGRHSLFADAPGQHSLLLHARHRDSHQHAQARFVRVADHAPADLDVLCGAVESALDDGAVASFLSVSQAPGPTVVGASRRWYLPTRRDRGLASLDARAVPLGDHFQTHQGVVSGADRVTSRNVRYLQPPVPLGTGIFILDDGEVDALRLDLVERTILRPVYRARDVRPFAIQPGSPAWSLDLRDGFDIAMFPAIRRHLERFRPILERRRECQTGHMPWWRLHWPRAASLFSRPRIVTPRRATSPRFAMAPPGAVEQSDLALITDPRDDLRRLSALLVVLNSDVIAEWCHLRGKHKGRVREYFGRPLEELPLPAAVHDDPPAFLALADCLPPFGRDDANRRVAALYGLRPGHGEP